MRCIKFYYQFSKSEAKSSLIEDLLCKILTFIFPQANPDYEGKIDDAVYWLLEFDDEGTEYADIPYREIGLDENYKPILKMPYKENYGFWVDSNMTYPDFIKLYDTEIINKDHFDEKWDELL